MSNRWQLTFSSSNVALSSNQVSRLWIDNQVSRLWIDASAMRKLMHSILAHLLNPKFTNNMRLTACEFDGLLSEIVDCCRRTAGKNSDRVNMKDFARINRVYDTCLGVRFCPA